MLLSTPTDLPKKKPSFEKKESVNMDGLNTSETFPMCYANS